jgi:hypothetical protein
MLVSLFSLNMNIKQDEVNTKYSLLQPQGLNLKTLSPQFLFQYNVEFL